MPENSILVVDHSAPRRDHLRQLLAVRNLTVREATSCEEAVSILAREPIPLVLSETELPGKSGLFLLKQIKKRYPEREVILITHGDSYTILQALRLGAYDFIIRPIDTGEIVHNAVDRAFEHIRSRAEAGQKMARLEKDNQALRRTLMRMKGLTSAFEHLMMEKDTESLLTAMLEAAMAEVGAVRGLVGIFDRTSGHLGLKVGKGIPGVICRRYSAQIPSGFIVEIASRGKPVLIPAQLPDKLAALTFDQERAELLAEPGLLAAPLRLRGRAVGIVIISGCKAENPLSPLELQFLTQLSNFTALALEKAGIIHQLKKNQNGV
jgi:FixJ family two-component response regulator